MRERFSSTLPVWHVDDEGRCGCGWSKCTRPGKHADERAPASSEGYGVITGARETGGSGLVVIDLDRKPNQDDGVVQFHELAGDNADTLDTLVVSTPSGGYHLYFQHPGHGIHIGNGKLASAIDVRGDKASEDGMAYVVGPGSAGYTVDPGDNVPIAPMPEWLLGLLLLRTTNKKKGFAPDPIAESDPRWEERVELGRKACLELPASKADGEGGRALFAICLRLVRGLELPLDKAMELIVEHFNPRCTTATGEPYPWAEEDIAHKLVDARDKSDMPCGLASLGLAEVVKKHATPPALRVSRTRIELPTTKRKVHDPNHTYKYQPGECEGSGEIPSANFAELVFAFTRGPDWDGCWQYDEFTKRIVCVDPPIKLDAETTGLSDRDLANIRAVLEHTGLKASKEDIYSAILGAASAVTFHPVRDYLASLPAPEDTSILDDLASRLFGADDPMADVFFRKFLISAVRRIFEPGCKVDTIPLLYGPQGFKKSTTIEVLASKPYFKDDLADLSSKDAAIGLRGRWIVEMAELDAFSRAEQSTIKAFLSRREDKYRPPYGKEEITSSRECVFVGSTNEQQTLADASGGRRFWPIHVRQMVDIAWLEANRDEIWAAAYALAMAGEPHWLTEEEERQAQVTREPYTELDPWHSTIEEACIGRPFVRVETLYTEVLNKGGTDGVLKLDRKATLRITNTLKRLGCTREVVQDKGERVRAWVVPDTLASREARRRGPAKIIPLQNAK